MPLEDLPTPLVPVEVTGTHLRRTALETASPLTVIDRRQIEHSGYQTLYELLRAQPGVRVNNAPVALSDNALFQANGLSGATGAAAVDLHGLGATATLFLIDGQRMAGYGLAQGEFSLVNDLESIPLALVERVEVLRDGASAIYGSDAMAGVVNIILRKQFQGVALDLNTGLSGRGDAAQHRSTVSFGTVFAGGGHLLLSADYLDRSPLLGARRGWARNAPGDDDGYYYFDGGQIGYARHAPAACSSQLDGPCTHETAALTSLQTALDSRSLLAHWITRWGRSRPMPTSAGTSCASSSRPARPPNSCWCSDPGQPDDRAGGDLCLRRRRPGARHDQVAQHPAQRRPARHARRLGLEPAPGQPAQHRHRSSTWPAAYQRARPGAGRRQLLSRRQPTTSPTLLAALSPTAHAHRPHQPDRHSALAPTARLPNGKHGSVSLAAGIEGYREQLDDQPDPLLIRNDVFQFQSPYVRRGNRWISAGYLELEAPLAPRLTANLAARADHSGGFGWALLAAAGLKWDVTESVALRGTLARGYRAPTLPELDRPQALLPEWRAGGGARLRCCPAPTPRPPARQLAVHAAAGQREQPALQPERSRSITLGMVLAPTPALGIALDAYQVTREHEIRPLPVDYALEHPDSLPGAVPARCQRRARTPSTSNW